MYSCLTSSVPETHKLVGGMLSNQQTSTKNSSGPYTSCVLYELEFAGPKKACRRGRPRKSAAAKTGKASSPSSIATQVQEPTSKKTTKNETSASSKTRLVWLSIKVSVLFFFFFFLSSAITAVSPFLVRSLCV